MVTLSEVPTLPDWSRRRARRRPSSGVWLIEDEPETLPRAKKVKLSDLEADVVTIPCTLRSRGAPAPRLIPIDLGGEAVTIPMAKRPPEPELDGDDEVPTFEMPREAAVHDFRDRDRHHDRDPRDETMRGWSGRDSDVVELLSVHDDDEIATLPMVEESSFDLDSLLSDVDSFERGPAFPSAACSWPARVEPQPAPVSAPVYPGRPFASAAAPTSQTDRPDGPTLGARAVSVLVAVAVVSLVLLAAAMIVTDKSGIEAFTELYALLGLY